MRKITDIKDLKGKKVLLRLDLNVPLDGNKITDCFRIDKAMPTLNYLVEKGAKILIISHIGSGESDTLKPVYEDLKEKLSVDFVEDMFDASTKDKIARLENGKAILFENIRKWKGEEDNDESFAKDLASLADIYINDAFSVSHRKHASIVGVPKFIPAYLGLQIITEIENLSQAFKPQKPFLFILGGAKVDTKLPLMLKFIDKADTLFIGGVLANDFFKAQHKEIGKSTVSKASAPLEIIDKIELPDDVIVDRKGRKMEINLKDVQKDDCIYDAGPRSVCQLSEIAWKSKLIVWNGPLGFCEKGFCDSTRKIARAITESKAHSILGGGDTLAAVPEHIQNQFSFVSTGGGAMLDFLANGTLVGIEAVG